MEIIRIPRCTICGNEDHFMLGRNNEMRCACCKNYMEDIDYVEMTEKEYEEWVNAKPGRI